MSGSRPGVDIFWVYIYKEMCWLPEDSILQLFTIVVFRVYNTDTFQNLLLLMAFPSVLQLNY